MTRVQRKRSAQIRDRDARGAAERRRDRARDGGTTTRSEKSRKEKERTDEEATDGFFLKKNL